MSIETEGLVTRSAAAYASADRERRKAILFEVLEAFANPQFLRERCAKLRESRRYLDFAFQHNNGFFVLYLANPAHGFQVRLHVWSPRVPPAAEHPHRHRMDFVSRILAGELHTSFYRREPVTAGADPGEIYREITIEGPTSTDFDAGEVRFEPRGTVALRLASRERYVRGASYYFDARQIHRVDTPGALTDPVITLTIWAPPFQDSVAYEPQSAPLREGVVPVARVTGALHDELLDLVQRHA